MEATSRYIAPFLLLFLFAASAPLTAQDRLLDGISDETCECVERRVPASTRDLDEIQLKTGLCVIEATSGKEESIRRKYGINLSGEEGYTEFAEMLGEHLALNCDHFLNLIMATMEEDFDDPTDDLNEWVEEEPEKPGKGSQGKTSTFAGIVESVSTQGVMVLSIGMNGGSQEVFVLGRFEGEGIIRKGGRLRGAKVRVTCRDTEVYSPDRGGFVTVKELQSIELL